MLHTNASYLFCCFHFIFVDLRCTGSKPIFDFEYFTKVEFFLIIPNMPMAFSLSAKTEHNDGSSYLSSSFCPFTNGSIQWICVDLDHSTRIFTFCVLFLGAFVLQKQLFWYKLKKAVMHCSENLELANLLSLWHDPTWFFLDWMVSFAK